MTTALQPPAAVSTPTALARSERSTPLTLFLLGVLFLGLLLFCRALVVSGDAALYATTIQRGELGHRSIHIGYYAVGWLAWKLLSPFGVPLDASLTLLSVASGVAAVIGCWFLVRALGLDAMTALVACVTLALSGNLLDQATHAEIYALQLALLIASWTQLFRDRPAPAGLLYGAALLVTPLSAFASAPFLWNAWHRRAWKSTAIAAGIAIAMWAAVVAFVAQDYFFGTRGLLSVGPNSPFSVANLGYNVFALAKSLTVLLPFAAVGLFDFLRRDRPLAGLVVLVLLFHLPVLAKMRENGVFVLAIYPFMALAIARGWQVIVMPLAGARRRALAALLATFYAVANLFIWYESPSVDYRESLYSFARHAPPGAALLVSWQDAVSFEFYGAYDGAPRRQPELVRADLLDATELADLLARNPNLFLLDTYYPGRASRLFRSRANQERLRQHFSILMVIRRLMPDVVAREVRFPNAGLRFYRLLPPTG